VTDEIIGRSALLIDFWLVLCRTIVDLSTVCAMHLMVTSLCPVELKARCVLHLCAFITITVCAYVLTLLEGVSCIFVLSLQLLFVHMF